MKQYLYPICMLMFSFLYLNDYIWAEKEFRPLKLSQIYQDSLNIDNGDKNKRFQFSISPDILAISIELSSSHPYMNIYLNNGVPSSTYLNSNFINTNIKKNKILILSRYDVQNILKTGTYYLELQMNEQIEKATMPKLINFQIKIQEIDIRKQFLPINIPIEGFMNTKTALLHQYEFIIPPDSSQFRIDILQAQQDLDIYLEKGGKLTQFLSTPLKAISSRAKEYLLIQKDSPSKNLAGKYTLIVKGNSIMPQWIEKFTILLSLTKQPNEEWIKKTMPIKMHSGLNKIYSSIVQIQTKWNIGSGTVVSPSGHILTNYHVIASPHASKEIIVAYTIDKNLPPEELFIAEIIRYDKKKDIALLKIKSDLYGGNLDNIPYFPYLNYTAYSNNIGDKIWIAGYPYVGSYSSRPSITLTQGIISGFDSLSIGTILKTDAKITKGSSGGAVINEQYEFLGIPTSLLLDKQDTNTFSSMGFIHPINILDPSWLMIIDQAIQENKSPSSFTYQKKEIKINQSKTN